MNKKAPPSMDQENGNTLGGGRARELRLAANQLIGRSSRHQVLRRLDEGVGGCSGNWVTWSLQPGEMRLVLETDPNTGAKQGRVPNVLP